MKKLLVFLFAGFVLANNSIASGKPIPPPLFKVVNEFGYFLKAEVIGKETETDSLGNNTVRLVLLVKESFISKVKDTIFVSPIKYNNDELNYEISPNIFMDINLNSTYYFGLGRDLSLSPYIDYNKIEIINNLLNYKCYTKVNYFFIRHLRWYTGRKMETEKFEKKLRKRLNR